MTILWLVDESGFLLFDGNKITWSTMFIIPCIYVINNSRELRRTNILFDQLSRVTDTLVEKQNTSIFSDRVNNVTTPLIEQIKLLVFFMVIIVPQHVAKLLNKAIFVCNFIMEQCHELHGDTDSYKNEF